ncbi:MAG: SecY-interacting protein Syd [Gammaproteobacteria bacterium]|jgi:SecY interacting protein Syd|nr:SecY-interacting protein Syd [Gammaproteobacteria bacterium]
MLTEALDAFFQPLLNNHHHLYVEHDKQWPSVCEIGEPRRDAEGLCWTQWQPVRRHIPANDFAGLEAALEIQLHRDIKTYYSRYWSANLDATAPEGPVNLLFLWSPKDAERMVENLIGHAVACRHNRTPFSVFFACTEPDSDLFLTINNDSGEVQLETPGESPLRSVAPSLEAFMTQLIPAPVGPAPQFSL